MEQLVGPRKKREKRIFSQKKKGGKNTKTKGGE